MGCGQETSERIREAASVIRAGGVVVYPTEAVFGLGCDPDNEQALRRLLGLKGRPLHKGLILIASQFAQLAPYLAPMDKAMRERIMASWPGPVTWLVPARAQVSELLRGEHHTLAVRVSAHPVVAALCRGVGRAIVSTSANRAQGEPARTVAQARALFGDEVDLYLDGEVDRAAQPSEIRDALSGQVIRARTRPR
jgi:L-threonylcarbamoyladenylate synthase